MLPPVLQHAQLHHEGVVVLCLEQLLLIGSLLLHVQTPRMPRTVLQPLQPAEEGGQGRQQQGQCRP